MWFEWSINLWPLLITRRNRALVSELASWWWFTENWSKQHCINHRVIIRMTYLTTCAIFILLHKNPSQKICVADESFTQIIASQYTWIIHRWRVIQPTTFQITFSICHEIQVPSTQIKSCALCVGWETCSIIIVTVLMIILIRCFYRPMLMTGTESNQHAVLWWWHTDYWLIWQHLIKLSVILFHTLFAQGV